VSGPVTLIDYGAGNLRSLRAALERLGADVAVSDDAATVARSARIVLPGVGAAAPAMRALRALGLDAAIGEAVERGSSLLGVCLGMQLLFERSAEGGGVDCLGLLEGRVERIGWARRLPHMGWNDVAAYSGHPLAPAAGTVCYFAHSYRAVPADPAAVVADTELDGTRFASLVAAGVVAGTQFHPEKSGAVGRELLARWLEVPVAA
jgi:glutamine amidotransferase